MPKPILLPDALSAVGTAPLFAASLSATAPVVVGKVPHGERRATFVESGRFHGDRLQGRVVRGMDWQLVRDDGAFELRLDLLLETDAGSTFAMSATGLRLGPAEVMRALAEGRSVDPADYYFRIQASFEASAPDLRWLNTILAVGLGHRLAGGPVYNLFEIL